MLKKNKFFTKHFLFLLSALFLFSCGDYQSNLYLPTGGEAYIENISSAQISSNESAQIYATIRSLGNSSSSNSKNYRLLWTLESDSQVQFLTLDENNNTYLTNESSFNPVTVVASPNATNAFEYIFLSLTREGITEASGSTFVRIDNP